MLRYKVANVNVNPVPKPKLNYSESISRLTSFSSVLMFGSRLVHSTAGERSQRWGLANMPTSIIPPAAST